MSEAPHQQIHNHILAALPPEDYQRLSVHLEPVELHHSQILYKAGGEMEYVYFPSNSMTPLISQMSDGSSVEVGVVGYEGMAGISSVLGVDRSPHEAMVQVPDGAMRLKASVLRDEFKRGGALHDSLLRYTQMLLLQTSQVAACNQKHSVEERLARWLLMSQDRCWCDELPFTQEFLSLMLGVRRSGVTVVAGTLQAAGLISYRRGHITITDREDLEEFSCECYGIIKAEFDRLVA